MKFFKVLLIIIISFFFSLLILFVGINFYLKWSGKAKESKYLHWHLLNSRYSSKYIFWDKSHCEKFPGDCNFPEEEFVSFPVEVFNPTNNERCIEYTKILFLGDSFTDAPWTKEGESYSSVFSKKLAEYKQKCVYQYRLATAGTGTDQQLAIFLDLVDKLDPDIVIWQYYYNDLFDNIKQALYDPYNQKLIKRFTLNNSVFLAGFLNQNLPFLRESTLGKHLMYLGETRDVLRNWPVSVHNQKTIFEYNKEKMTLALNNMGEVAKEKDFAFYTTLASLECQVILTIPCWYLGVLNNFVRDELKENSDYIAMDQFGEKYQNVLGLSAIDQVNPEDYPFETERDINPAGARHFSIAGNNQFGSVLFENYMENIIY